jgi:hypothetical protein
MICSGTLHDARIYKKSALFQRLAENTDPALAPFHLLGDSAYPLSDNMLVPFRDNGHLSQAQ